MNAHVVRQHADLALAHAFAAAVYDGRELIGHVHRTERGFIAENADGETIGRFSTAKDAASAVVGASRVGGAP
jgi:hypothetical protein